jgi:hypothetical protein
MLTYAVASASASVPDTFEVLCSWKGCFWMRRCEQRWSWLSQALSQIIMALADRRARGLAFHGGNLNQQFFNYKCQMPAPVYPGTLKHRLHINR